MFCPSGYFSVQLIAGYKRFNTEKQNPGGGVWTSGRFFLRFRAFVFN